MCLPAKTRSPSTESRRITLCRSAPLPLCPLHSSRHSHVAVSTHTLGAVQSMDRTVRLATWISCSFTDGATSCRSGQHSAAR